MTMAPRKVLFLTNSEFGELSVMLATSSAIMEADRDVEVHLATFGGAAAKAVAATSDHASRTAPGAGPIVFHELRGPSWLQASGRLFPESTNDLPPSFRLTPSFRTIHPIFREFVECFQPFTGDEFVALVDQITGIVGEVKPDVVAVDSFFAAGITAARYSGAKWVILSPNTVKDFASPHQPWGADWWKYPALGSTFAFPVPWHQIPLNIYYRLYNIYLWINNDRYFKTARYVKFKRGTEMTDIASITRDPSCRPKMLLSFSPELDQPCAVIPDYLLPCGPIVRSVPSVAEVDPELEAWLARGPTLYINLGTHADATEDEAAEMAKAVRVLLDTAGQSGVRSDLQVLWKLRKGGDYAVDKPGSQVQEILGKEMGVDRVRITSWVSAEPMAVLQTGHVVCSLNHGGANSFNEAITTGVPQVILPQWLDCYDFAHRAEMLGIGRWGSRTMKPRWSAEELAPELVEVVVGKRHKDYLKKAQEISEKFTCSAGRNRAAQLLLEEMGR